MIEKLKAKLKRDKADANLVSLIFALPLLMIMLITMIDTSMYYSNRSLLLNIANDSARSVAIFGGDGNATQSTTLEKAYGVPRSSVCTNSLAQDERTQQAYKQSVLSALECNILQTVSKTAGFTDIAITEVTCTPDRAQVIGQEVKCSIFWEYGGVPGSAMSLVRKPQTANASPALTNSQLVEGTAKSEVGFGRSPGDRNYVSLTTR